MSKSADKARKEVPGWLSANLDNCEPHGFIRLGESLLKSPIFQALSPSEKIVYLCCCVEAGKERRFYFPRQTAQKVFGLSWSTVHPALKSLQEKGFVKMVYSGRLTREPNLYEFSFAWKSKNEP